MTEYSSIVGKYKDTSVEDLGASLLQRKSDIQARQRKQDRKDRRIQQALAVLLAGQGVFKNAFKRRQAELKNLQTIDLLNSDEEAKQMAFLSNIINFQAVDENNQPIGLINFTEQTKPNGQKYTVDENVNRFFANNINSEGFRRKVQPYIDQRLQFDNKDLASVNPPEYDRLSEEAAKAMFENLITDNSHIDFINSVNKDLFDGSLDINNVLQKTLGITSNKLNSYKRRRYSALENEYRSQGLFSKLVDMYKSIGQDDANKTKKANIFKNITEDTFINPTLNEVLPNLTFDKLIGEAYDEGIRRVSLSPSRYLNEARTAKYENMKNSVIDEIIPSLQRDLDYDKVFATFNLRSKINERYFDRAAKDLKSDTSLASNVKTRTVALSLRLQNDPNMINEIFDAAGVQVGRNAINEIKASLDDDNFRLKLSAFLVLKAGQEKGLIRDTYVPSDTALASIQKSSTNLSSTKFGYNDDQAREILDPVLTTMFGRDGTPSVEYTKLSQERKAEVHYKFILQLRPNTPEGRAMAERFDNETPNPLGLPFDEYMSVMQQQQDKVIEDKIIQSTTLLGPIQKEQYMRNIDAIDDLNEQIRTATIKERNTVTGRTETREATVSDINSLKGQVNRLEIANENLLADPKELTRFRSEEIFGPTAGRSLAGQLSDAEQEVIQSKEILERVKENLPKSRHQLYEDNVAEAERRLELIQERIEMLESGEKKKLKTNQDTMNNENQIRYDIIARFEGKAIQQGYVPQNRQGQALGQSGVTIGTGFDLGNRTVDELQRMGFDDNLITKLSPYIGLKKQEAINFLNDNPLRLSREETNTIDRLEKQDRTISLAAKYQSVTGKNFFELDRNLQTVYFSIATQFGLGSLDYKNWGRLTKELSVNPTSPQAIQNLIDELLNFSSVRTAPGTGNRQYPNLAYANRRVAEAQLLQELL